MLRRFVQAVCDAILLKFYSGALYLAEPILRMSVKGVTSEIPFSPLKAKVTICVSVLRRTSPR